MYKIPLDQLKEKILATNKLNEAELDEKIKAKINELSGLITEDGAAHIISNELGIDLAPPNEELKIKQVYAGMKGITTLGKVIQKYDIREFSKGESTGKVCSLVIGDETGTIRLVFWNNQVDQVQNINVDDILQIKDAYVRENRNDREIHVNDRTHIDINPEGKTVNVTRQTNTFDRKEIKSLDSDQTNVEIVGTVVQIFDPRFFYLCPTCNKRVTQADSGYNCAEHGAVTAQLSYVLNLVVDDGTGNIRSTFWKNQANHLVDKTEEDFALFKDNLRAFEDIKTDLLGEQFKLMGRVTKNIMFDRFEFSVHLVQKADPKEELQRLEDLKNVSQ
jgi:replication factor A1